MLTVAICGSFHQDAEGLRVAISSLKRRFDVLSPSGLDFVDPAAQFVRLPAEVRESEHDIEERHLEAMREADLVWLHAPDGYVGTSAAMELGVAAALGIPVFATAAPGDVALVSRVVVVDDPADIDLALLEAVGQPGRGIDRLQRYYRRTAERRGWAGETARDTLLLITEEVGELAQALRHLEALPMRSPDAVADVGAELADVQLYLVHLANAMGLTLADAVTAKERVNAQRFGRSFDAA
ncbi:MAG TPA: MazG nucleotide pyrophosphohydrolase domain-containing protein [Acidimicrobiales bacterium]|nr:MazG nucleotide pyrophosphohydrolase domain-containing protein [Acidimicrobiales bacterium]